MCYTFQMKLDEARYKAREEGYEIGRRIAKKMIENNGQEISQREQVLLMADILDAFEISRLVELSLTEVKEILAEGELEGENHFRNK